MVRSRESSAVASPLDPRSVVSQLTRLNLSRRSKSLIHLTTKDLSFTLSKLDKLPEYLRETVDWFLGRATRRKLDKDATHSNAVDVENQDRQTPCDESKQYLETTIFECVAPEYKLREIVDRPEGVDCNEWLAYHTIAFFDHINMLYGTISEFCTMSGCPETTGPGNRQYIWVDEKGKRTKLPAPQYIDYALTYTQKTVNDESVFPTKFDKDFPSSFESHVKKIIRLLFNVLAHIYQGHFKEIVLLNLHSHLNCLFSHLVLFNDQFKLVDEKELELLVDDVYQVNISEFESRNQMNIEMQRTTTSTTPTDSSSSTTTTTATAAN